MHRKKIKSHDSIFLLIENPISLINLAFTIFPLVFLDFPLGILLFSELPLGYLLCNIEATYSAYAFRGYFL